MSTNPLRDLAGLITRVQRLEAAQSAPSLPHSSLDNATLPSVDADGNIAVTFGRQWDGTNTVANLVGPTPPTPTTPITTGGPGLATITWDGGWLDSALTPMDYARTEVYVSTDPITDPDPQYLTGTIETPQGAEVTTRRQAGTYYVRLASRSLSGKVSALSAEASVEVQAEALDEAALDEVRADLRAEIASTGAELDERITGAFTVGQDAAAAAAAAAETASGAAGDATAALTQAQQAQGVADAALTDATAATNAAAEAAGLAAGKADVLIQAATPAAGYRAATTLWIDTTSAANTPKRWSGTAWVAVTDRAATDAAAAAAEANATAADAATAAAAAQAAAGTAETNAQAAITAASGKNSIYRSTAVATGTGGRAGDLWWQYSSAAYTQVIGQWVWSGTTWIAAGLAHQVISSVDVGALTVAGTATMAQAVIDELWTQVVRSRRITTDMLLVGAGTNLLADARLTTPGAWTTPSRVQATGGRYGGGSLLQPASTATVSDYAGAGTEYLVPVRPGQVYRLDVSVRPDDAVTAAGQVRLVVRYMLTSGSWGSATVVAGNTAALAAGAWADLSGQVTVPADATHLAIGMQTVAAHTGAVRWSEPAVYSMITPALSVDGLMDARAINGATITGALIRTAATGRRVQIDNGDADRIKWFSGDSAETAPGVVDVGVDASEVIAIRRGFVRVQPPMLTASARTPGIEIYGASPSGLSAGEVVITAPDGLWVNDVRADFGRIESGYLGLLATGYTFMSGYRWRFLLSDRVVTVEGTRITRAAGTPPNAGPMTITAGTDYWLHDLDAVPADLPLPLQQQEYAGWIHYGSGTPVPCKITVSTDGRVAFRATASGTLGVAGANVLVIPSMTWLVG